MSSSSAAVNRYLGLLLESRERAHVMHLRTRSFAGHKALQTYYEGIVPLLDSYAETYMRGRRTVAPKFSLSSTTRGTPKAYFQSLSRKLSALRPKLPRTGALDNIRQEIDALVYQTMYMLSLR